MNVLERETSDRIKRYWGDRARSTDPASTQATTYDVHLREHEIATLKRWISALDLPPGCTVVDLGCGDGHATVSIGAEFPALRFIGLDWSDEMLSLARRRLATRRDCRRRIRFRSGDMRRLSDSLGTDQFEVIVTVRSLINLPSSEQQYDTIRQIADHLVPGGYFLCVENFVKSQENFNHLRTAMGLPEIPVRWHNIYFEDERFLSEARKRFDSIEIDPFLSSYYLATRVIYSAACHLDGQEPDYLHPIHQVAARLPVIGDYCPIRLVKMRRKL